MTKRSLNSLPSDSVFYCLYLQLEARLATWMFVYQSRDPNSPTFSSAAIDQLYPGSIIVNLARSVLSAVSLFMIAKIMLNQMRCQKDEV